MFLILLCAILCTSSTCVRTHSDNLKKLGQYNLTMPEPSGLAISADGKRLYMVSDRKGQIYQTDLQGVVQKQIDINGGDYEGIAINQEETIFYLLDENKNKIECFNTSGDEICDIDLKTNVSKKSGPEGIDLDWTTGEFFIVNESKPTSISKFGKDYQLIMSEKSNALSDLSAVTIDPTTKELWLLSDQDQKLIRVSPAYDLIQTYLIDIIQMEGLAIDFQKKIIYIVSDSEEELHVFKYSD